MLDMINDSSIRVGELKEPSKELVKAARKYCAEMGGEKDLLDVDSFTLDGNEYSFSCHRATNWYSDTGKYEHKDIVCILTNLDTNEEYNLFAIQMVTRSVSYYSSYYYSSGDVVLYQMEEEYVEEVVIIPAHYKNTVRMV